MIEISNGLLDRLVDWSPDGEDRHAHPIGRLVYACRQRWPNGAVILAYLPAAIDALASAKEDPIAYHGRTFGFKAPYAHEPEQASAALAEMQDELQRILNHALVERAHRTQQALLLLDCCGEDES